MSLHLPVIFPVAEDFPHSNVEDLIEPEIFPGYSEAVGLRGLLTVGGGRHNWDMSAELPAKLRKAAERQAGIVSRQQSITAEMSPRAIEWKVRAGEWRQVYWGVYVTFTGPLSRQAQLWAAVLYAGAGAVLSHESAAELQGLIDQPTTVIHVTVPARRRVTPVPGLAIHRSDLPERLADYPAGEVPITLVADTVIDLAEASSSVEDVYGWVGRAFGRKEVTVDVVSMLAAVALRKKLRWRAELPEAIVAAAGGAHSALELLWEKNVEQRHGLPISRKQVPFTNENGQVGFRDREYVPWGVIIELDGKKSHPNERRGQDHARDRQTTVGSKETMRYDWKDVRYEACKSAVAVIRVLWRRGWRGRPKPCSAGCPVAALLAELDNLLAADPVRQRKWLEQQAVQEAAQQAEAERLAAGWAAVHQVADDVARARREAQAIRSGAVPPRPARR